MQHSKTIALLYLVGATLVGGGIGYGVDRHMVKDRLCAPRLSEAEYRERFYDDLGLDPAQRAAWGALLDERVAQTSAVRASYRPKTDSIMAAYNQKTVALLNPEQRKQLEQRRVQMRRGDGARNDRNNNNDNGGTGASKDRK
jgi:hypothetical protein